MYVFRVADNIAYNSILVTSLAPDKGYGDDRMQIWQAEEERRGEKGLLFC